jgi:spore maturation protein CgeB
MKILVFGLTVTSSWGNGHATLWRGLSQALGCAGHDFRFFERNISYYADNRDIHELPGGELILYRDWEDVAALAIVTSYCPDALAASELILSADRPVKAFYDLDTPVTLSRLSHGNSVDYIGPRGLRDFDLVLSYTGGRALDDLASRLGARQVAPLYGHVDPEVHRPAEPVEAFRADLSYIGTYAADRQGALEGLFVESARRRPDRRFVIAGAQYPADFPWFANTFFVRHLPPLDHPAFYSSSRWTLNVTRQPMVDMGWCPSGRLFEAAACGTAVLSDAWEGLEAFFDPGSEIIVARNSDDVLAALDLEDRHVRRIAAAARERVLAEHTSAHRAEDLIKAIENSGAWASGSRDTAVGA